MPGALGPADMSRILAVTDALGIHREKVRIPLARGAEGVRLLPDGSLRIVVPDDADIEGFVAGLPAAIERARGL